MSVIVHPLGSAHLKKRELHLKVSVNVVSKGWHLATPFQIHPILVFLLRFANHLEVVFDLKVMISRFLQGDKIRVGVNKTS